jgi:hypothetical protein
VLKTVSAAMSFVGTPSVASEAVAAVYSASAEALMPAGALPSRMPAIDASGQTGFPLASSCVRRTTAAYRDVGSRDMPG